MSEPAFDSASSACQGQVQSATQEIEHAVLGVGCGFEGRTLGGAVRAVRRARSAGVHDDVTSPTHRRTGDDSAEPAAMTYSLRMLRGFELRRGDEAVSLPMSAQRLAAFLALHDRPVQRIYVAGTLWIDSSEEQANASLRTALWRLRQVGPAIVDGTSTHLSLAAGVAVDVHEAATRAQRVLEGGPSDHDDLVNLAHAGELLPDWYDDWVVIERERLRQACLHALEQISAGARDEGRFAESTEAALAAVALEPLRESAHRMVIEAHLAEGNVSDAIRQYRLFERLIGSRLGLQPSARMQELMAPVTIL